MRFAVTVFIFKRFNATLRKYILKDYEIEMPLVKASLTLAELETCVRRHLLGELPT